MSSEALQAARALGDVGVNVLLLVAIGVLWRWAGSLSTKIEVLQASMLAQSKTDADRLLEERTMVLPIVERSTDALRRTTDQLAVTTSLVVDQRDQLARLRPNGNG